MDGGSSDKSPQVFAPDVTKTEDHHVHDENDGDENDDDKTKPSSSPSLPLPQKPPPKKKQKQGGGRGPPHRREKNSIELAYQDVIIETRRQSCTDGESGVVDGDDEKKNTKVVDQHRPDSPRFFFQESYEVTIKPQSQLKLEEEECEGVPSSMSQPTPSLLQQIVHHHVNSLVAVTIGDELRNNASIKNLLQQQQQQPTSSSGLDDVDRVEVEVEGVEFTCKPGPSCNAGQTRKKHAKMLKKGPRPSSKGKNNINSSSSGNTNSSNVAHNNNDGIVTPTTMIAKVTVRITTRRREKPLTQNATPTGNNETQNEKGNEQEEIENDQQDVTTVATITIPFYACVWGTIVELNPEILVRPNLLLHDPLMDGHLAIIHPAGTFPPPSRPSRQSSSLTPPPTPPPQTESAMQ